MYVLPWSPARRANIRLDLNEFDHPHHPDVLYLADTHASRYPDPALSSELVGAMGLDPATALLTAGSDDALDYLTDDLRDTKWFVFVPAYGYAASIIDRCSNNVTKLATGTADNASLSTCLSFYAATLATPSAVYLANPSNPLGTIIDPDEIELVATRYPATTFVIDEAYIEFSNCRSCATLVHRLPNVVVTRTFSKAYGLAGLRLGYVIAHPTVVQRLRKVYNEKRVTDHAVRAGLAVFRNKSYYDSCVQSVCLERDALLQYLSSTGWYHVRSHANFVTFYAPGAHSTFEKHGVTVRDLSDHPGYEGFLRVTIGNAEHMASFMTILKSQTPPPPPLAGVHTPKDHVWKLKRLFQKLAAVLNTSELRGRFWLDSGSLLGWHRNAGGVIPWDDDVDLGVLGTDVGVLLALRDRLAAAGLRLKLNRTKMYYQVDDAAAAAGATDDAAADATDEVHVDIFPFVADGEHLVNADPRFVNPDAVRCNFRYVPDDLFPLRPAVWYDTVAVNVPNNYESILRANIPSDFMHFASVELAGQRRLYNVDRWTAA